MCPVEAPSVSTVIKLFAEIELLVEGDKVSTSPAADELLATVIVPIDAAEAFFTVMVESEPVIAPAKTVTTFSIVPA